MPRRRFRAAASRAVCVLALPLVLAAACAARREPLYLSPDLERLGISTIAFAPVADAREDPFEAVQMIGHVRRSVEGALAEKGYTVAQARLTRDGADLTASEIAQMDESALAAAAASDVRYLVAVSLDRVTTPVQRVGETTRVKISGRLVDLAAARTLWRDTAQGEADLGGLLTVLTGPSTEYEAAYDAARLLVSTLPHGPARGDGPPAVERGEHSRAPLGGMRPAQGR